jgi:hypothetical protein
MILAARGAFRRHDEAEETSWGRLPLLRLGACVAMTKVKYFIPWWG